MGGLKAEGGRVQAWGRGGGGSVAAFQGAEYTDSVRGEKVGGNLLSVALSSPPHFLARVSKTTQKPKQTMNI